MVDNSWTKKDTVQYLHRITIAKKHPTGRIHEKCLVLVAAFRFPVACEQADMCDFEGNLACTFPRHIKFCKQNTAMLIVLREN